MFLRIEVLSMDPCQRLGLMIAEACEACHTYYFDSSNADLIELCSEFRFTHNMHVEADCCEAVPIQSRAWSNIKALYR